MFGEILGAIPIIKCIYSWVKQKIQPFEITIYSLKIKRYPPPNDLWEFVMRYKITNNTQEPIPLEKLIITYDRDNRKEEFVRDMHGLIIETSKSLMKVKPEGDELGQREIEKIPDRGKQNVRVCLYSLDKKSNCIAFSADFDY